MLDAPELLSAPSWGSCSRALGTGTLASACAVGGCWPLPSPSACLAHQQQLSPALPSPLGTACLPLPSHCALVRLLLLSLQLPV